MRRTRATTVGVRDSMSGTPDGRGRGCPDEAPSPSPVDADLAVTPTAAAAAVTLAAGLAATVSLVAGLATAARSTSAPPRPGVPASPSTGSSINGDSEANTSGKVPAAAHVVSTSARVAPNGARGTPAHIRGAGGGSPSYPSIGKEGVAASSSRRRAATTWWGRGGGMGSSGPAGGAEAMLSASVATASSSRQHWIANKRVRRGRGSSISRMHRWRRASPR
ncbi:hypothetical protein I4F81_007798 [Pyropia yezoensis]|uniref:Uncharacterized protein n=1 Tax=Pyropia yezoensis TaxID=2788 RepID=A0ACC3C5K8_PYRYE|nr:hypothetical protein I4F81_007798 [Neopyropia yezoensis]